MAKQLLITMNPQGHEFIYFWVVVICCSQVKKSRWTRNLLLLSGVQTFGSCSLVSQKVIKYDNSVWSNALIIFVGVVVNEWPMHVNGVLLYFLGKLHVFFVNALLVQMLLCSCSAWLLLVT